MSKAIVRKGCTLIVFDLLGPLPSTFSKHLRQWACGSSPLTGRPNSCSTGQVAIPTTRSGGASGAYLMQTSNRSTPDSHTYLSSITARSSLDCHTFQTGGGHSYPSAGHCWGNSCSQEESDEPEGGMGEPEGTSGGLHSEDHEMTVSTQTSQEPLLGEDVVQVGGGVGGVGHTCTPLAASLMAALYLIQLNALCWLCFPCLGLGSVLYEVGLPCEQHHASAHSFVVAC